ncbi:MAG: response regulator [Chloroflexi bacterium]|nr:MAG: response regulator [Chloroflexota bacterium]
MKTPKERILLVESDPDICDLIARQTLQPMGYQVEVAGAAAQAIQRALRLAPDVILASMALPGLSAKDLLVALSSQGFDVPVIVIAGKGMEGDVIQAFRLGASDYLGAPIREAEVVTVVERALKQVRARREREELARQLKDTNQELQSRVRELTTIFAIGKAVISITNQHKLLAQIVEGGVYVTEADIGWLLLREENGKDFLLSAYRNLPDSITEKIGQVWEDGLSSLVALSGESLTIYGSPLKRFKISSLGQSALVAPIKAKKEVVGLLVMVRKEAKPFGANNQALLEAVADYASISLLNARLFKALEDRAYSLQAGVENARINERIGVDLLNSINADLSQPLNDAAGGLSAVLEGKIGALTDSQTSTLRRCLDDLLFIESGIAALAGTQKTETVSQKAAVNLTELVRKAVSHYRGIARQGSLELITELPSEPVTVSGIADHLLKALEGLLSTAIRSSTTSGTVTVRVKTIPQNPPLAQCTIHIGNQSITSGKHRPLRSFGISLQVVKDILTANGGKVWVEKQPDQARSLHFTLPLSSS